MVTALVFYAVAGAVIGLSALGNIPGAVLGYVLGVALYCLLYSR